MENKGNKILSNRSKGTERPRQQVE